MDNFLPQIMQKQCTQYFTRQNKMLTNIKYLKQQVGMLKTLDYERAVDVHCPRMQFTEEMLFLFTAVKTLKTNFGG